MPWANSTNVSTDNVNSASDNPADARADIEAAFLELKNVIAGRGAASGVASLDSSSLVPAAQLPSTLTSATGNISLQPANERVSVSSFVNLAPVAYASLPASPAKGDIAYLTTDGAGATKEQLIFYNGTAWKYVTDATTTVAAS
jgi:hypothetical protein